MELGFDPLLSRFEPRSFVFFEPVAAAEIDNVVTLVNAAPSRAAPTWHDRHDNGERATPSAVPATQRNHAEILQ
jgi:hypothetical protein